MTTTTTTTVATAATSLGTFEVEFDPTHNNNNNNSNEENASSRNSSSSDDEDVEAAIHNRNQTTPPPSQCHSTKYEQPNNNNNNNNKPPPTASNASSATTTTASASSPAPAAVVSAAGPPISIPPATKAPKQTLQAVYAAGKYKAGLTLSILMIQSFMAGIYIAFAGHLYLAVGGGILGSALFPGGLIAVILTSAELFTGDALIFVASVLGQQVKLRHLLRNWTVAWCCNFAGCLCWAYFLSYLSGALEDSHAVELTIKVAEKKALNDLSHVFIKAIGANFMVCVAVWQGTCAEEVAGKVLALWFPTAAFVMMGFDHVVANMFLIPVGMMYGAQVSVGRLFAALAVATMGNAVGGGICVGFIYWYVFDSLASFGGLTSRIRQNMRATRGMVIRNNSLRTNNNNNSNHNNGLTHRWAAAGKNNNNNNNDANNNLKTQQQQQKKKVWEPPRASTADLGEIHV